MRKNQSIIFAVAIFCAVSLLLASVFNAPIMAFASTITEGGVAPEVASRPLEDVYFVLMLIFAIGIVAEIVALLLILKKIKNLQRESKGEVKLGSFVPYALATLLPAVAFKWILAIEVIVFAVLFFVISYFVKKLLKLR